MLPKGSRIPMPAGKKLRAFTYWEKVDDIDLSVIGLDGEDRQIEFSWRTMASNQSEAITYSEDETSGYKGGSEYFDIEMDVFREKYPSVRYLFFCNNIFTYGMRFADCICRAGFMMRDTEDSGQIFESKTVASSYTVNALSSFAYLFGLDLERNEFVWLNSAVHSREQVAGETDLTLLKSLFTATETINVYDMFRLLASEIKGGFVGGGHSGFRPGNALKSRRPSDPQLRHGSFAEIYGNALRRRESRRRTT